MTTKIMVVPKWFGNKPESIRKLAKEYKVYRTAMEVGYGGIVSLSNTRTCNKIIAYRITMESIVDSVIAEDTKLNLK